MQSINSLCPADVRKRTIESTKDVDACVCVCVCLTDCACRKVQSDIQQVDNFYAIVQETVIKLFLFG